MCARGGSCGPLIVAASLGGSVELPGIFDALQLMKSSIFKAKGGTRDEVAHSPRNEHFTRACKCADSGRDVHRDTAEIAAAELNLAGVQPCSHGESECFGRVVEVKRAADAAGRPVEGCHEAVAGVLDDFAAEAGDDL